MTEINWSFQVWVAGELKLTGALSTIDLSFPAAYFDKLHLKYGSCKLVVRDSRGKEWIKEW